MSPLSIVPNLSIHYTKNIKWNFTQWGTTSHADRMYLICRGECDMKQNKRAMLLIFTTAIVTSGLAILPWFIIWTLPLTMKKAGCFLRSNQLFLYYKIPKILFTQLIIINIDTATHMTTVLRSCFSFFEISSFEFMCMISF